MSKWQREEIKTEGKNETMLYNTNLTLKHPPWALSPHQTPLIEIMDEQNFLS